MVLCKSCPAGLPPFEPSFEKTFLSSFDAGEQPNAQGKGEPPPITARPIRLLVILASSVDLPGHFCQRRLLRSDRRVDCSQSAANANSAGTSAGVYHSLGHSVRDGAGQLDFIPRVLQSRCVCAWRGSTSDVRGKRNVYGCLRSWDAETSPDSGG